MFPTTSSRSKELKHSIIWKSEKKELEKIKVVSTDDESTDSDHPLNGKCSTDEGYPLNSKKFVDPKTLEKLKVKYSPGTKQFVQGECSNFNKVEKANIGHLFNKQLKDKLEKTKAVTKRKGNRSWKVGMNKLNNYTYHLSNHCKLITNFHVLKPMSDHSMHMPMILVMPNMPVQSAFPSS